MPSDAPGSYLVATLDGKTRRLAPAGDSGDSASADLRSLSTTNATASAVREAGARCSSRRDAGPGGRRATCADPQGAVSTLAGTTAARRPGRQLAPAPGTSASSTVPTRRRCCRSTRAIGSAVDPERGRHDPGAGLRRPPRGNGRPAHPRPSETAPPGFPDVVADSAAPRHGADRRQARSRWPTATSPSRAAVGRDGPLLRRHRWTRDAVTATHRAPRSHSAVHPAVVVTGARPTQLDAYRVNAWTGVRSGALLPRLTLGPRHLARHQRRVDVVQDDLARDDDAGDIVARSARRTSPAAAPPP